MVMVCQEFSLKFSGSRRQKPSIFALYSLTINSMAGGLLDSEYATPRKIVHVDTCE
jgi:hypothetical protein